MKWLMHRWCVVCLSGGLLATHGMGKNLKPAQHWLEIARLYQESSVFAFHEILATLQMNVTEFANKSGQHEDRLRSYVQGELSLDEQELDGIERYINDVKESVRKLIGNSSPWGSPNSNVSNLLYGVNVKEFRQYAQTEKQAQELKNSGDELTVEQQQLVNKVDALRDDAFARIEYNVRLSAINYYKNKKQTSSDILTDILARLRISVPELATYSGLYAARIFAHQRGEIIFSDEDMQSISAVIEKAVIPQPMFKERLRSLVHKSEDERKGVSKELRLELLLKDFNDAVRVERYLCDSRCRTE